MESAKQGDRKEGVMQKRSLRCLCVSSQARTGLYMCGARMHETF